MGGRRQVYDLVPSRMIVSGYIGQRLSAVFATVRSNDVNFVAIFGWNERSLVLRVAGLSAAFAVLSTRRARN